MSPAGLLASLRADGAAEYAAHGFSRRWGTLTLRARDVEAWMAVTDPRLTFAELTSRGAFDDRAA